MTRSFFARSPWTGVIVPVLGLLLLGVPVAAGFHHHADEATHPCAVCTASHAPAVATDAAVEPSAPLAKGGRTPTPELPAPPAPRAAHASSRAPPAI